MDETLSAPSPAARVAGLPFGFLVVDEFLRTLVDARALKTAFELGLIDRLAERASGATEALGRALGLDAAGLRLLLDLLRANGVVEEHGGDVRLGRRFREALRYRDLLEAKLDFTGATVTDFADLFTALVRSPGEFTQRTRLFELFDYRRCLEPTLENYLRARNWMRFTSALTRYEAQACMALHDFGACRRMLDIGGNSGEFILQLCRRHAGLHGTVFDLPLVCEIGMEHVFAEPEHARIGFIRGDLRRGELPGGYDLVSFKSMLHDWPAQETGQFIGKAVRALAPGGTLLIFERGRLRVEGTAPLSLIPSLLFFRSYRPASEYVALLAAAGLEEIETREVMLDSPFLLVTGRKPAGTPMAR